MKPVGEMSTREWLQYREDKIDAFYGRGGELKPTPGCTDCDPDNDYVCFGCECNQLEME
jgi:hypothetical protein